MYCFSLLFEKKGKTFARLAPCIHIFERMKAIRFFYACASRTERNMPSPLSSAPLPCAIVFMQTVLEKREALEGKTKRLEKNAALKRARCEKIKDPQTRACGSFLVPVVGVEPTWYRYHRILSPARLPIPPYRQKMRPLLQPRGILYHIHAKKSRDFQKKAKKIRNGCKNSKIPLVTAKNI